MLWCTVLHVKTTNKSWLKFSLKNGDLFQVFIFIPFQEHMGKMCKEDWSPAADIFCYIQSGFKRTCDVCYLLDFRNIWLSATIFTQSSTALAKPQNDFKYNCPTENLNWPFVFQRNFKNILKKKIKEVDRCCKSKIKKYIMLEIFGYISGEWNKANVSSQRPFDRTGKGTKQSYWAARKNRGVRISLIGQNWGDHGDNLLTRLNTKSWSNSTGQAVSLENMDKWCFRSTACSSSLCWVCYCLQPALGLLPSWTPTFPPL